MRKGVFVGLAILLLATTVHAGKPLPPVHDNEYTATINEDCLEPTWENMTVAYLSKILEENDAAIEEFAYKGSKKGSGMPEISGGSGKGFKCSNLVARFTPEAMAEIETQFDMRRACQKAKEVAQEKVEEYRENPWFVVSGYRKLGEYDFDSKKFELPRKYPRGAWAEVPESYDEIHSWPHGKGVYAWGSGKFEKWAVDKIWYTPVESIEEFWVPMDEAEQFAKDHERVFVRLEFSIKGDKRRSRYTVRDGKMWIFETDKMENLIAVSTRKDSKHDYEMCNLFRDAYIKSRPKRERVASEMTNPCNKFTDMEDFR